MSPAHRTWLFLFTLCHACVACFPSTESRAADCAENCITGTGWGFETCSTDPVFDYRIFLDGLCEYADSGGYSIPEGTLYSVAVAGFGGCGSRTTVEDAFVLTGIPDGTPVLLVARLDVHLITGCILGPGFLAAGILDEESNVSEQEWDSYEIIQGDGGTRDETILHPIEILAGQPFRVRFYVETTMGECQGWNRGAFTIEGLPANAVITSCNGYVLGPVQTTASTWGRLKVNYR